MWQKIIILTLVSSIKKIIQKSSALICFSTYSVFGRYINHNSLYTNERPNYKIYEKQIHFNLITILYTMTKWLIIGLATMTITGTALLATGMYASMDSTSTANTPNSMRMNHMQEGNPQDLIATLSWKVSPEAITALQTLMAKHKTEMDTMQTNTGTKIDSATMEKQREGFKTEMDALMSKYPDLKAAMPTMGKWGMMHHADGEIETIMATLPTDIQTQLKSIRNEYQTKQEALRNEEKTKIDTILAQYPEIKTKLDAIEVKRPQWMGEKWGHSRGKWIKNNSTTETNN